MNCISSKNIEVQGHRGCRGLMPENTLEAFKKAIALPVDTLELDVVVSKDNMVVVSHEPYMNNKICLDPNGKSFPKTEAKRYNLYRMNYSEIKTFDCGLKFHKKFPEQEKLPCYKPTLKEVISICDLLNPKIKYNIELKATPELDDVFTPKPDHFVSLVLETLKKPNVLQRTNLQSFDLRILEAIKKQEPKIAVAILVDKNESISKKIKALSYKPEIISPNYKLLDAKTVKLYQDQGYKVIPWTVNNLSDMRKMIALNVNGIITDYPNRLIKIVSNN